MDEKKRIQDASFNGYLVLEFDNHLVQGVICWNHSQMLGFTWREAEMESIKLSESAIRRKGKSSWAYRKKELFDDYFQHYEKFNLTESGITAFIKVNFSDPDKPATKKEMALRMLKLWIKSPYWTKVNVNE